LIDAPLAGSHAPRDGTVLLFATRYNLGGGVYATATGPYAGAWSADGSVTAGICTGTLANGTDAAFAAPTGTQSINGTTDKPLFDKLILGNPLTCAVPAVPNGSYKVRLLFAELYRGGNPCAGGNASSRTERITIEGATADTLDVLATGGGCAAKTATQTGSGPAFAKTYTTTISDGQLDVVITPTGTTDYAVVSALELAQQ
jgi:hypothetical protein